jgi:hypothetical protein
MGITAVRDLVTDYFGRRLFANIERPQIMSDHLYGRRFEYEFVHPFDEDYRHVVVSRNWYNTIISGYLYHKAGKECWLDLYGKPEQGGWLLNNTEEHWELRLLHHNLTTFQNRPWRPGNGRDLCRYLAEESEEEGLRVYTTWALVSFINPLLQFRRQRLGFERREKRNRTMFVCYEQLVNPKTHSSTAFSIYRWLYPNKMPTFNISSPNNTYQGGHASDANPVLRARLHEILSKIDLEFFNFTIRKGSTEFGCG